MKRDKGHFEVSDSIDSTVYGLFMRQHDYLTTFGAHKQTILQANKDYIVNARWLMGLFCKTELWALASAWEIHDGMFTTSCNPSIIHDWSVTSLHVDIDWKPNWAWLCGFAPFIIVKVKLCCRVNSALHKSYKVNPRVSFTTVIRNLDPERA